MQIGRGSRKQEGKNGARGTEMSRNRGFRLSPIAIARGVPEHVILTPLIDLPRGNEQWKHLCDCFLISLSTSFGRLLFFPSYAVAELSPIVSTPVETSYRDRAQFYLIASVETGIISRRVRTRGRLHLR